MFFKTLSGRFLLLSFLFRSYVEPLVVMLIIPLSLTGAIFGHMAMGLDFSMPSMLGYVALAGVVINNSILLVDFINLELKAGEPLEQAVIKAGAVRLVPIFLTQLSTIVGASFMLSDPIFQGLALAMISGIIVSTALTLGVIPVMYYMYLKLVGPENVVEID